MKEGLSTKKMRSAPWGREGEAHEHITGPYREKVKEREKQTAMNIGSQGIIEGSKNLTTKANGLLLGAKWTLCLLNTRL